MLPTEMGCGCGMTCWCRLSDWHKAQVWQTLHETLLARLEAAHLIDWSRASRDSTFIRTKGAKKGGLRARPRSDQVPSGGRQERPAAGDGALGSERSRRAETAGDLGCDPTRARQAG